MKISDLLKISVLNLIRRKLRTFLTVLGVIIGTVSVVIMLSIGFGISAITQKMVDEEQALTQITIYPTDVESKSKKEKKYLNDDLIKELSQLEHVEHVSPYLELYITLKQGKWEAYSPLTASDEYYYAKMKLKEGEIPKASDSQMRFVYGNNTITRFFNSKTGKDYYTTNVLADVDYHKTMFTIFEEGGAISAPQGDGQAPQKPAKKYIYKTAGVVEGGLDDYNPYYFGVYTHIELLKKELKKIYRGKTIPNQPTTAKGKPLKFLVYSQLFVYADNLKNVETVQKAIKDMGFETYSENEWLNQVKKQTQTLQGMLGGIGLVSLVVAAIGIANTMMMSIYERTKEIGIIKVLGCDMNRIRDMFLLESAMIGFSGGICGIVISYGVSYIANHLPALQSFFGSEGSAISIIPPWLGIIAIIFATFMGMIAGLLPSLRAMKLSPLAALRNE